MKPCQEGYVYSNLCTNLTYFQKYSIMHKSKKGGDGGEQVCVVPLNLIWSTFPYFIF